MKKTKRILKPLIWLVLFYAVGECFLLLENSKMRVIADTWIITGYFAFVFAAACVFHYWRHDDGIGKRLLLLLLLWLFSWVLEYFMAGSGIGLTIQRLFYPQNTGEYSIAVTQMLKVGIQFRAMLSATAIVQLFLCLYQPRKQSKSQTGV